MGLFSIINLRIIRILGFVFIITVSLFMDSGCKKKCYVCTHVNQSQWGSTIDRIETCDPNEVTRLTYNGNGYHCK